MIRPRAISSGTPVVERLLFHAEAARRHVTPYDLAGRTCSSDVAAARMTAHVEREEMS
jgi:hypothetical protein